MLAGARRVIDLGCGNGVAVELLRARDVDAIGIDTDAAPVAEARRLGLPVEVGDLFDWLGRARPGEWDGVLACHVVEHFDSREVARLLLLSRRILAPGGRILVVTPNTNALHTHLDSFWRYDDHVRPYHPALLARMLEDAGFADVQVREGPLALPLFAPTLDRLEVMLSHWRDPSPHAPAPPPPPSLGSRVRRWFDREVQRVLAPQVAQMYRDLARAVDELTSIVRRLDRPPEVWLTGWNRARSRAGCG
jgi:SAM-dependent methyltransferase